MRLPKIVPLLAANALALAAAGCSGGETQQQAPIEVTFVTAKPGDVSLLDELPGRVVAYRIAEIRPQVGGIVQRRLFEQGAEIRAGQPLFQINPAPFQADASSAAATLQRAQATLARARVQEQRLRPLVDADAISRQSYDDAVVQRDQASADLAQARAALDRRRLDLGFARVTAPISGRIGQTRVTEGALVSAADTNPLATVQQIDQVYVDVRQPVSRMEALRDAVAAGTADQDAPVEILSQTGKVYPVKGRMLFSDISVDAGTGDAAVRILVPNPTRQLLPGMFVRARLPRIRDPHAILLPQQAVRRTGGKSRISIVDAKGQVQSRDVTTGDVVNGNYVILSGVRAGERVIVEGHDRVMPDVPVKAVPYRAPANQR